MNTNSNLK